MSIYRACRFFVVLMVLYPAVMARVQASDIVLPMNVENFGESWDRLDGPAGRVLSAIIQIANNQLVYQIHSPSHSFKAFLEGRYKCISPDAKAYYDDRYEFIESAPFRETRWVAVYDPNRASILGSSDLLGKKVGLLYDPSTLRGVVPQGGVVYDVYSDLATNLRKLERGRLDAVVVPALAMKFYMQDKAGFGHLTFEADNPLAIVHDRVLCHDTKRGREVIAIVNEALKELKVSSP